MKILFIRHGETTQNIFQNFENIPDCFVPLTKAGEKQAEECAEFLKDYCNKNNINSDNTIIIVSPFKRARQTAQIINGKLQFKNMEEDVLTLERQYGLFDNLTREQQKEKYQIADDFQNWMYENQANFYTKLPLGESNFDVYVRARIFLPTLKEWCQKYENVFIISHGGFLKNLEMAYFKYSPEWFTSTPFMDNCAIKLIDNGENKEYIYKGPKKD